jgi:hypothetical protein
MMEFEDVVKDVEPYLKKRAKMLENGFIGKGTVQDRDDYCQELLIELFKIFKKNKINYNNKYKNYIKKIITSRSINLHLKTENQYKREIEIYETSTKNEASESVKKTSIVNKKRKYSIGGMDGLGDSYHLYFHPKIYKYFWSNIDGENYTKISHKEKTNKFYKFIKNTINILESKLNDTDFYYILLIFKIIISKPEEFLEYLRDGYSIECSLANVLNVDKKYLELVISRAKKVLEGRNCGQYKKQKLIKQFREGSLFL